MALVAIWGIVACAAGDTAGRGGTKLEKQPVVDETPAPVEVPAASGGAPAEDMALFEEGEYVPPSPSATATAMDNGELLEGMVCNSKEITFQKLIPTVMILVDRSGSMFDKSYGETDRWEATRQAALTLEPFSSDVQFALATYTTLQSELTCPAYQNLEIAAATDNWAQLITALPDSKTAKPNEKADTPTGEAIAGAVEALKKVESDGPKYLLVLTDGEPDTCGIIDPNCGQDMAISAAQEAFTKGIQTIVVGIGDDVGVGFLNDLAHAGQGKAVPLPELAERYMCAHTLGVDADNYNETTMGEYTEGALYEGDLFFQPDNLATFQAQLGGIIEGVRSCAFEMDTAVERDKAEIGAVGFILNDGEIELLAHGHPDGWTLNAVDPSIVELQGSACQKIQGRQADLIKNVKIEFPCEIRIPKPPKPPKLK